MKTSDVLRAAKKRLWDGRTSYMKMWHSNRYEYICHAIDNSFTVPYADRRRAMQIVHGHLRPYNDAKIWLECVAGIPYEQLTQRGVQAWRRKWLDKLIAEHEAKGD